MLNLDSSAIQGSLKYTVVVTWRKLSCQTSCKYFKHNEIIISWHPTGLKDLSTALMIADLYQPSKDKNYYLEQPDRPFSILDTSIKAS